jgi:hypothetical protein
MILSEKSATFRDHALSIQIAPLELAPEFVVMLAAIASQIFRDVLLRLALSACRDRADQPPPSRVPPSFAHRVEEGSGRRKERLHCHDGLLCAASGLFARSTVGIGRPSR